MVCGGAERCVTAYYILHNMTIRDRHEEGYFEEDEVRGDMEEDVEFESTSLSLLSSPSSKYLSSCWSPIFMLYNMIRGAHTFFGTSTYHPLQFPMNLPKALSTSFLDNSCLDAHHFLNVDGLRDGQTNGAWIKSWRKCNSLYSFPFTLWHLLVIAPCSNEWQQR